MGPDAVAHPLRLGFGEAAPHPHDRRRSGRHRPTDRRGALTRPRHGAELQHAGHRHRRPERHPDLRQRRPATTVGLLGPGEPSRPVAVRALEDDRRAGRRAGADPKHRHPAGRDPGDARRRGALLPRHHGGGRLRPPRRPHPGAGDLLGHLQSKAAGRSADPGAKDGVDWTAGRRHRARLQQSPHRHLRRPGARPGSVAARPFAAGDTCSRWRTQRSRRRG